MSPVRGFFRKYYIGFAEGHMGDTGDGWCLECGEYFHLDDTGGYNPPCGCKECGGAYCRSCCAAERMSDDEDERDEDSYPVDRGGPND